MTIIVRKESAGDVDAIDAVTIAAFLNAPHTSHTEHLIVKALRHAEALSISLVAEDLGIVIGHVAVSPVTISDGTPGWYGLGPISVAPGWQRRGVGTRLMQAALSALEVNEAAGCVLVGNPAFYGRFGFKCEPSLILPDVPAEYFQAIALGGSVPRGTVAFHHAFGVTG